MVKCHHCGKEIGILALRYTWLDKENKIAVHDKCLKEYEKHKQKVTLIAQEKLEKKPLEENIIGSDTRSNKNVRWGWMGLFIIILIFISPLINIYFLGNSWDEAIFFDLFIQFPNYYLFSIINIVIVIFLMIFSVYVGLSLYFFKDNAIYKTKVYLIAALIYGIISPFSLYFMGFPEEVHFLIPSEIGSSIFRSFIFFGIWYWFITSSKTVKRIYFSKEYSSIELRVK